MDYTKATKDQLWAILKADVDCPLPLLEGAFQEAVNRGLIKQFIISVIKKKGITPGWNQVFHMAYDDLVQIGYEAALEAMRKFEPGRGRVFTSFLFLLISQAYGQLFQFFDADKRQREETSYQTLISDGETMEYYLVDNKTNVEKTVIRKLELEEKLSVLKTVQLETFKRFFIGYTLDEIAEQMNTKKATAHTRLQSAFIRMTGHKINLHKLGLYERVSTKKVGA